MCKGGTILPSHLPLRIQGYPEIDDIDSENGDNLEDQVKRVTEDVEKKLILQALDKCDNSRTKAAEMLKISRKTLFNKMKRLGIG